MAIPAAAEVILGAVERRRELLVHVGVDDGRCRATRVIERGADLRGQQDRHRAEIVTRVARVDDVPHGAFVAGVGRCVAEADHEQARAELQEATYRGRDGDGIGLEPNVAVRADLLLDPCDGLGRDELVDRASVGGAV